MSEKAKVSGNAEDRGKFLNPKGCRRRSGFSTINQCKITELTVKDRVLLDIGTSEQLTKWSDIDWKTVKKRVRNLRQRIYRATKNHQWNRGMATIQ